MLHKQILCNNYAKRFFDNSRIFNVPICLLYINRHFTLPSLCEASHNDGFGEGFEQRPIQTSAGELYVHLWQYDGFSLRTRQELEAARHPMVKKPIHHSRGGEAR